MPEIYDYTEGSTNTYTVEDRHQLILPCFVCHKFTPIKMDGSKYHRYFIVGKEFAREIWPDLTVEQVDHIITGIHPECSDEFYGEEND